MITIPESAAPFFMAGFALLIVGSMIWIAASAFRRNARPEAPLPLAPWKAEFLTRMQLDGRWQTSAHAFGRRVDGLLYAPLGERGAARAKPRVAHFSYNDRALGFWVLRGTSRLEMTGGTIELHAARYWDIPWSMAPQMTHWSVVFDQEVIGTLTRETGSIVACDHDGQMVGRWMTPIKPGQLFAAPTNPEGKLQPLFTDLQIGDHGMSLRLPFRDARINRLDFAGQPFFSGSIPESRQEQAWTLAFLAVAVHASLILQSRTTRSASHS